MLFSKPQFMTALGIARKIIREENISQPISSLKSILIINYLKIDHQQKQFTTWFKTHFPTAKIELKTYDNIGDYLLNAQKKSLWPDITSAADINDRQSVENGSFEHWNNLINFVSSNNTNSVHIFLDRQGVYDFSATALLKQVNGSKDEY